MTLFRYECVRRPTKDADFIVAVCELSGSVEAESIADAWEIVKQQLFLAGTWDCELRHGRRGFVSQSFTVKPG